MRQILVALAAILITSSAVLAVGRTADTSVGKVYVSDRGMTLYMLSKDPPNVSTCYGKCVQIWPPYKPSAGAKLKRGWAIIRRQDGSRMWAYKSHPLYTFFKDKRPGDAYGAGIRDHFGSWHAATVSGSHTYGPVVSYKPKLKAGGSYGSVRQY